MKQSREGEKSKPNTSRALPPKNLRSKAENSVRSKRTKAASLLTLPSELTTAATGPVLTQEEYRARVAKKAFEIYEKRRAWTEVDDWIEAERVVKLELLNEPQGGDA
ncbi:MAG: hypothetical protein QM771_08280 [Nitrospira sp.]